MRFEPLLDEASGRALQVDWLSQALAPASDYGDRVFADLRAFTPGSEEAAQRRATHIAQFAQALDDAKLDAAREVFRNVPDATSAIARASMGDTLGDPQLLELQRFFDALIRIDTLLAGTPGVTPCVNDDVRTCARALELGRAGKFGFYLADEFDTALAKTRASLAQAQAEYDAARGRASSQVARALGREEISGSEFIVMRADLNGSLPSGVRVVREAPTYFLCELDHDEATLAALERRDAQASALAHVEEAVRGSLSAMLRTHVGALDVAARTFGEIDVLVAAARFARAHDCVAPEIVNEPVLSFVAGCFVPMAEELERQGRHFTPITVTLDDVAVLTGPNMGGKSVCLRTCGFIALCAAFGLPVPAHQARVGLFDEIAWLGIGSDGEVGGLLSSFAREVVRLRDLFERDHARVLVLFDEFARTTSPREGKALLVAVIARLRERHAVGLLATHLGGLAGAAGVRHFAVRGLRGIPQRPATGDLNEALASLAKSMDYTIEELRGEGDRAADAIALASLLGLDDALIAAAQRAIE